MRYGLRGSVNEPKQNEKASSRSGRSILLVHYITAVFRQRDRYRYSTPVLVLYLYRYLQYLKEVDVEMDVGSLKPLLDLSILHTDTIKEL